MKRLLISMIVILILTVMTPGAVLAEPQLHKATGGISLQVSGGLLTYDFVAIQLDIDGNAKGKFRFTDHVSSRTFQADVKYLSVHTRVPSAWIGTVITEGDEGMEEGTGVVFRVFDNGEGKGALPDGVSIVQINVDPAWALDQPLLPLGMLTIGNVKVR